MTSQQHPLARKKVLRRFVERTLKGERLGFEAYVWAAQRVTGFLLLIFLIFHLYTLSSVIGGEAAYDQALGSMGRPLIKIGEIVLLWVVLFHGLNGARLVLCNLFPRLNHRRLAYSFSIASIILAFVSIPFVLKS